MECKKAITKTDIEICKDAILEFRAEVDPETVIDQVFQMITHGGYELVYIPNADNSKAAAFIGYRKMTLLRTGPMIYVDDLFTFSEFRGQGYAGALLDYIASEAANEGIKRIDLDSGYTLHTAHRLYLNKGYYLACNHFARITD
ncbi:MAG TPA: GNAT family N-acetyltransferase [Mucilaginibacter sp.]|jgi:GNAT superfamily N-acetyltransferase